MDLSNYLDLRPNKRWALLNTIYQVNRDKKVWTDTIFLVFKNIDTGEKVLRKIDNPVMEVYIAREGTIDERINHKCTLLDNVDRYDVHYLNKESEIANILGGEALATYKYYAKSYQMKSAKESITRNPRVFSSDKNIEDFYKYKCLEYFGSHDFDIDKAFLDIETDLRLGDLDLKTSVGESPVNVVTIVSKAKNTIYTMVWDYSILPPDIGDTTYVETMRKQAAEIKGDFENIKKEWMEIIRNEYKVDYDVQIVFMASELDILKTTFELMNTLSPDVCEIWNMAFDFRYLYNRIKNGYGLDPIDIIRHPDFAACDVCYYYFDSRAKEIPRRGDYAVVPSYTLWICQMILYGNTRKGESKIDKYSLDFIGERTTGHKKLEYKHIASHFKDFALNSFKTFIIYNIIDVIVQVKVEDISNDANGLILSGYSDCTRYQKCFRENTLLTNVAYIDWIKEQHLILGNNINQLDAYLENDGDDVDEGEDGDGKKKFKGAFIGDPVLNDHCGDEIFKGSRSKNIFSFVFDYDYTSLYPTINALFNIFVNALIGKVFISGNPTIKERLSVIGSKVEEDDKPKKKKKDGSSSKYDRGAQFVQDYELNESTILLFKWMDMPSYTEVMDIVDDMGYEKKRAFRFTLKSKKSKKEKRVFRFKIK